jgi:hypothetical protein
MTTLNVMGPASLYYAPYGPQLELQQSSSCPSVQEQYIPADTGFIQPIGPIAISLCHIANSDAYDSYLNLADPYETLFDEQLPMLSNPSVMGQIVPAATDASSRTAYSAEYSSDKNASLDLLSHRHSPAASLRSQSSTLPPDPGPSDLPEQQKIHVAQSRLNNSPRPCMLRIILMYGQY